MKLALQCILGLAMGAGLGWAATRNRANGREVSYTVETGSAWGATENAASADFPWEVDPVGSTIMKVSQGPVDVRVQFLFLDRLQPVRPGALLEVFGMGWGSEQVLWSIPWRGEEDPLMPPIDHETFAFFKTLAFRLRDQEGDRPLGSVHWIENDD